MKKPISEELRKHRLFQVACIILLLIAFLSVFLFFYFQFQESTLQSITTANESFGSYVDSTLTLSNANIHTSAMQIFYTSSIRKLRTDSDLSIAEKAIGHRDLGNFVSSSLFIENIMIYNRNTDMIFTSESSYSSDTSEKFHDKDAASVLTGSRRQIYLTPFKRQSGNTQYYSFLFFDDAPEGYSSMLLDINADWYETHLLGSNQQDRHVIVDKAGSPVIFRGGAVKLPEPDVLKSAFDSGPESGYILSDDSFLLQSCWVYHKMGNTGWYFLESFELEDDAPGLVRMQHAVLAVFGLIGMAILGLSIYLFFFVLPGIIHISNAVSLTESGKKNLSEKIDELVTSHNAYQASRILRELRNGILPEGLQLPIAILSSSGEGEKILSNISNASLKEKPLLISTEKEDIFVFSGCTSKQRNLLIGYLRRLEITGHAYLSSPCYSEEQLRDAFSSIEELSLLSFLYPDQPLLLQETLLECGEDNDLLKKSVSSIEGNLKKGQFDIAHAQWLLLFNSIRKARAKDFFFAITYINRMLSNLDEELGMDSSGSGTDSFESISELNSYIDERFKNITDTVNEQQLKAAESLTHQVWDSIYADYTNEAYCAQVIAEKLNVSVSSLNRQFRSSAGISIGDAIKNVRIDKVCSLLRKTELSVEQIAEKVGISNTKYLFVLFKKHTGMTPAQFRSGTRSGSEQKKNQEDQNKWNS